MPRPGRALLVYGLFCPACGAARTTEAPPPGEPAGTMDKEAAPAPAPPPAAESEEGVSSTKDEDHASSIEAAIAEFDRARLELSGLLGRELGGAEASRAPAAGAAAPEPARSQD